MKKEHVLGILFFGGLWGIAEATLGNYMYRHDIPYASVALTAIGLVLLTLSRPYFSWKGAATLIAGTAMLYKFLNEPFFACHLFGIVLLGAAYDLFFSTRWIRNRSLAAVLAVYVGYAAFAIMLAYIVRYQPWVKAGFPKVFNHIAVSGSLSAVVCAVCVPLAARLADRIKARLDMPFSLNLRWAPASMSLVTTAVWVFGAIAFFHRV
jgi:hypothetical protein